MRGANYLERARETPEDWYYANANGVAFSPDERARLPAPMHGAARVASQLIAPAYAEVAGLDETTRMQYVDLFFWLVGDILLKTDKMSMAHSLESRVPFLDKEVFNVSRTIPTPFKANGEQTKIALREAAERAIPKDWAQKEKLGFHICRGGLAAAGPSYLTGQRMVHRRYRGVVLQHRQAGEAAREHRERTSRKIWIVYMFLMWYKICAHRQDRAQKPAA